MKIIEKTIPAPASLKDWPGHYVTNMRPTANFYVDIPAGAIFRLTSCTINKYMTAEPCLHCGMSAKIVFKGTMKAFLNHYRFIKVVDVEEA